MWPSHPRVANNNHHYNCTMRRKKKEKGLMDLSSEAKTKSVTRDTDRDQVASEDCQKDARSDTEVILLNR